MIDFDYRTHVHKISRDPSALAELISWLKADWKDLGEGFLRHRQWLTEAVDAGDLYVATCEGMIMGFQLGETNVDLLQVYSRYRRQGVGGALVWAAVARAAAGGKELCTASTSEPSFWERIGFEKTTLPPVGVPGGVLMVCDPERWLSKHADLAPASVNCCRWRSLRATRLATSG
jgi:GNAT superfamily N-acetyltransferase